MTEQHDNTSNTDPASTESDETPVAGVTTLESPQSGTEGGKELKEARFRRERNEARDERDALATRIERMQRSEIERLAAGAMAHPGDLFTLSGNTPADYLTDDGDVDADKVAADVAAVLAERPGLSRNSPAFDPSQGTGGKPKQPPPPTLTWASAFRRRN
ncbi:hypothetical protein [Mycolicibacterium sp. PDY-3]|uniref:hypothetical protein n=1 Tax=Mycolicibacterium sp. PDY-3 TaxID=3376069 RepID=UPI00379EC110